MDFFKKSSIGEMCKQIVSAPVIFKAQGDTECLAFFNNEESTEATKMYILFPDSSMPKYVEGNDIYNVRSCIYFNLTQQKAKELYAKVSKTHKSSTVDYIMNLISKLPSTEIPCSVKPEKTVAVYNKRHACALTILDGSYMSCYVKDLIGKHAEEVIFDSTVMYDVTFNEVLWAAAISSKEFTALKKVIRGMENA